MMKFISSCCHSNKTSSQKPKKKKACSWLADRSIVQEIKPKHFLHHLQQQRDAEVLAQFCLSITTLLSLIQNCLLLIDPVICDASVTDLIYNVCYRRNELLRRDLFNHSRLKPSVYITNKTSYHPDNLNYLQDC